LFGRRDNQEANKSEKSKILFGGINNEEESHPTDSLFLKSKHENPRNLFNAAPPE
jgi:hypothetical protein